MKRRAALIFALISLAFGGSAVAPASEHVSLTPTADARTCSSGYRHAIIGGSHKCLRRGQYCALRYESRYHYYGYHCHRSSRDSNGNYHLT